LECGGTTPLWENAHTTVQIETARSGSRRTPEESGVVPLQSKNLNSGPITLAHS